ncbi:hypothetical protein SAMN05518854_11777 [Variovorax sp. YR266]|uniref:hypothetical protein n=1 Tax=Variovorax sp. YR266 TaxID=1884386 RepID=UPI00089C887F|nr:hypothetical protein [Variovorax sp. YR266]SDZ71311.1 hypothetical protein SAMN05518854_11777 [Variovorax sp. YR266]
MPTVFVQFADASMQSILSVFACAQDPAHYPYFAEIDEVDSRYQAYLGQGASPSVPFSVTRRQGRLALLAAGKLSLVADAIAALPSPEREAAEIEWDASTYERASPFLAQLGTAIGLDDAALDALFIQAAAL